MNTIETTEQYDEVLKEIANIYGEVPKTVINLATTAFMKNLAIKVGLKKIIINTNKCLIEFYDKEKSHK